MEHAGLWLFVISSTIGCGTIPVLPVELRHHIYQQTYPLIHRRCARCSSALVLRSVRDMDFVIRPHTMIENGWSCVSCLLPSESLSGQYARRYDHHSH